MKRLLLLAVLTLASLNAYASFEIRGHYGALMGKPSEFNGGINGRVLGTPPIDGESVFGVDAVYVAAGAALDLGLRYENFSFAKDGPGTLSGASVTTKTKLSGSRIAVIGDYHLVNTPTFRAGVNASIGLSQNFEYKQDSTNGGGSTVSATYKPDMSLSYGLAAEAALRFNRFLIGIEGGYLALTGKIRDDSNGLFIDNSGKEFKFDLSGPYYRGFIGYAF